MISVVYVCGIGAFVIKLIKSIVPASYCQTYCDILGG